MLQVGGGHSPKTRLLHYLPPPGSHNPFLAGARLSLRLRDHLKLLLATVSRLSSRCVEPLCPGRWCGVGLERALGRFDTELQPAGAARRPSAARRCRRAELAGCVGWTPPGGGRSRDVGCRGRLAGRLAGLCWGGSGGGGRPALATDTRDQTSEPTMAACDRL